MLTFLLLSCLQLLLSPADSVDGDWSDYGEWSKCSAECGEGTQTRTRECNNNDGDAEAKEDGYADAEVDVPNCEGVDSETRACTAESPACCAWQLIERDTKLSLESPGIEVQTNSEVGSNDRLWVLFRDSWTKHDGGAGGIKIDLSDPPKYSLDWCGVSGFFSPALPEAVDKVWQISKTPGHIRVLVNDLEVLNKPTGGLCKYSHSPEVWNRAVPFVEFQSTDTASDGYRMIRKMCESPEKCKAEWYRSSDISLCQRNDAKSKDYTNICGDCTRLLNTSAVQCGPCPAREYTEKAGLNVCIRNGDEITELTGSEMKCICDHMEYDENCESACQSLPESDEVYGNYLWPTTSPGKVAQIHCAYNEDSKKIAYRHCDPTTTTFRETNFTECKSNVHEQINNIIIEAEKISSVENQNSVSDKITNFAHESASFMSSHDVKLVSYIIDKLIDFKKETDAKELNKNVTNNILDTVDSVQKFTNAKELSSAASSMRNSLEKLADTISEEPGKETYKKEQIILQVVVKKPTEDKISFNISGDQNDFIFSAQVPANKENSSVIALLYDSSKFFPDETIVEDLTTAFAEHFTISNVPKKTVSKIVSWIAEIKYAKISESTDFDDDKTINMSFAVAEEHPNVHYKMALKSSYECTFYDKTENVWVTGAESRCTTTVQLDKNKNTLVSCQCSHMTSFAVLMSFTTDYDPIEGKITSILLGISLVCLLLTILSYLPAKERLKKRPVKIMLLLAASLIFSIITFYFMENIAASKSTDSTSHICSVIAFLMNYFWLCQIAWMVCEAVMLYRNTVSHVLDNYIHRHMLKFNLACWGIPLIFPIIGITWGKSDFANPKTCFLRRKYGLVTFYGPLVLGILFNIVSFIRVAWEIYKRESTVHQYTAMQIKRRKSHLRNAITIMALLGIAWLFGFLLIIQKFNTIWIRWLFIISNSTQGIFIFILHPAMDDVLREVWRKLINTSADPSHFSMFKIEFTQSMQDAVTPTKLTQVKRAMKRHRISPDAKTEKQQVLNKYL